MLNQETGRNLRFARTRIAPTPSGFLHLGNVLSFALTAALARKTGAKVLLRIDDLDRERVRQHYVQDIFDTLNFLQLPWDEGPRNLREYETGYAQWHRMELYRKALQTLRDQDLVFACTCSRTQLLKHGAGSVYPGTCRERQISLDTSGASWRLRTKTQQELLVKTPAGGCIAAALPASMDQFIVRKKDGLPAYQLTSLVDDLHYDVDLVVRGEDLWPSTLAQHYLSSVLGENSFRDAAFFHHSLLVAADGTKLSKSAGATSIQELRRQGKKPAEVYELIGQMMGVSYAAGSWEGLAAIIIDNGTADAAIHL